jgi:hypothetical protein
MDKKEKTLLKWQLSHDSGTKHAFERDFDLLGKENVDDQEVSIWLTKDQSHRSTKLLIVTGASFSPPRDSFHGSATRLIELLTIQFSMIPTTDWEKQLTELNPTKDFIFVKSIVEKNKDIQKSKDLALLALEITEDAGLTPVIDVDSHYDITAEFKASAMHKLQQNLNDLTLPDEIDDLSSIDSDDSKKSDDLNRIKSLAGLKDEDK